MPEQIYGNPKEWFAYAKHDLDSANFLLSMKPVPIEIICFHCQQAAEKAIKTFMVAKNITIIKTHDLGILLEKCSTIEPSFKNILVECSRLTDYAVQQRYPFSIEIEENDMRLALHDAQSILDFIQAKLEIEIFTEEKCAKS